MPDHEIVEKILTVLQEPPWARLDIWLAIIGIIIAAVGAVLAYKAFVEAEKAQRAASNAATAVKTQSDAGVLTEIAQDLARLQRDVTFDRARRLLAKINRKLKRIIAPQRKEPELSDIIQALEDALKIAKEALQSVKPVNPSPGGNEAPYSVFNAIEGPFTTVDDLVAELSGLLDKKIMHFGEIKDNGKR